jgi:hypothetical protein
MEAGSDSDMMGVRPIKTEADYDFFAVASVTPVEFRKDFGAFHSSVC